jgi:hypothetical protein
MFHWLTQLPAQLPHDPDPTKVKYISDKSPREATKPLKTMERGKRMLTTAALPNKTKTYVITTQSRT